MTETREIIPIENVELDIERIADQLFLGPQAGLLEKIHNFKTKRELPRRASRPRFAAQY